MNSVLFLLNATAIAILVAFHFQPDDAVSSPLSSTHYGQRLAPRLAILKTQVEPGDVTRIATGQPLQQAPGPTQHWAF